MKYYKDSQNNVHAFEFDGSQDEFIRPELTPITKAKADALRTPVLSDAEFNAVVDAQLNAADLKIIRALAEGDTARINAHKVAQVALRATRK